MYGGKTSKNPRRTPRKKPRKKTIKNTRKNTRKGRKAGDFVKTGSYGCVFRPPLLCQSKTQNAQFRSGYISKLMKKSVFDDETNKVQSISNIFNKKGAAWVNKYFVIPQKPNGCNIDIRDHTNKNFILNAETPPSNKAPCLIAWQDIQSSPKSYKSLNQIDGGCDLEEFLKSKTSMCDADFNILNKALIDLLLNGIYEMNNLGIYHFDINAANIVYKEDDGEMRLIDWGFAKYVDAKKIKNAKQLEDFVSTLVARDVLYYGAHYGNALLGRKNNFENIKYLVQGLSPPNLLHYFSSIMENSDLNHVRLCKFYERDQIKNIIAQQFKTLVQKPKLEYFKQVFLPNSDIFAFLHIYLTLRNIVDSENIKHNIDNLIEIYMLQTTYSKEAYNMTQLIASLRNLSNPQHSSISTMGEAHIESNIGSPFVWSDVSIDSNIGSSYEMVSPPTANNGSATEYNSIGCVAQGPNKKTKQKRKSSSRRTKQPRKKTRKHSRRKRKRTNRRHKTSKKRKIK